MLLVCSNQLKSLQRILKILCTAFERELTSLEFYKKTRWETKRRNRSVSPTKKKKKQKRKRKSVQLESLLNFALITLLKDERIWPVNSRKLCITTRSIVIKTSIFFSINFILIFYF